MYAPLLLQATVKNLKTGLDAGWDTALYGGVGGSISLTINNDLYLLRTFNGGRGCQYHHECQLLVHVTNRPRCIVAQKENGRLQKMANLHPLITEEKHFLKKCKTK